MKRKIEKYLKKTLGSDEIFNDKGKYKIGCDIQACLNFIRQPPASATNKENKRRKRPSNKSKKRPDHSTPSRGGLKRARIMSSPVASEADLQDLHMFLSNLKGGPINGVYVSALERRRRAESPWVGELGSLDSLKALELTPSEISQLPPRFRRRMEWAMPSPMCRMGGGKTTDPLLMSRSIQPSPLASRKQKQQSLLPPLTRK